ncbi:MAG: DinB family protein [Armatimonadota bacterium]
MTSRLLRHNAWATRVLLERCRSLTPQQVQQRFDIGPESLHDTLRHIIGAMLRWSDRIADRPVRESEMMRAEFLPEHFTRGTALVHVLTHGMHHRATGPQHAQTPGGDGSPRPRRHRMGASYELADPAPRRSTHRFASGRPG